VNEPINPSHISEASSEGGLLRTLYIRATGQKVVQLSSKVVKGALVFGGLLIMGAVYWGMQQRKPLEERQQELISNEHKAMPEGMNNLAKDYTGKPTTAPRVGPPLPGDLGRPMLNAGVLPGASINAGGPVDPEVQRQNQEIEAARVSRLFSTTNVRQAAGVGSGTPQAVGAAPGDASAASAFANDETFAQSGQDRKLAFVNAAGDGKAVSQHRLQPAASPFIIQAGTIIPGALLTGIRSDLPGEITAQVTEHVYDSLSGQALLIPQGSRLIGSYDSQVAFGQSRVLLVWTRLILTNGKSILLDRQKGADVAGYSGLEDEVDNHWGALFKAAAASTLLSVGSQVAVGNSDNQLQQAMAQGAALGFNQIGRQIIGRNLNIQPTLTIRPGFPVRVIVNRDLILESYKTGRASNE
jgi:type IV secretory pathway VirB10-like protein